MSALFTGNVMDRHPTADTNKYVQIKTYYFKTEEDILTLFKTNKIQYKKSIYEVVSKNINRISIENNRFSSKFLDCVFMEANVNKLVMNHEASFSIARLNNQLVDIVFNNVMNEINELISTFIKTLNEEDRILIIDGLVFNSTKSSICKCLISVQPVKKSSIVLLKLTGLSLEKSNLLQNKNLAKITGPGIYLLFGNIKKIIKYTDEEFMLLRIQSFDKCYIRVRKYPHNIHYFKNISEYEITTGAKCDLFSYKVDILVKKPCKDFLSLISNQQIILYNVKVIHSNESGTFSLYVNGKSTNLIAHKVIPQFKQIPTSQHYLSELSSCNDSVNYSPSSPEYLKSKPDQTDYSIVNNINKRAYYSSYNENMNCNNVAQQNYQPKKILKPNLLTDNQVQQYDNRSSLQVSSLCLDVSKGTNETNQPIKIADVYCMPFNSDINTMDSTNVNNLEVLGVSSLRCIGPCKPICIEPYLNDDNDSINLVSGYCTKCFTFTPISFLTPSMDNLNDEYECLRCRDILFLTFFFKLNFLYGENHTQSIELQCYKEKAIDLLNQLTKKDINVKDYLSHYSYRQTVVEAMRNFIFKQNNIIIVFHDLPSENVHIFVSLSTTIDLKIESI